MKEESNGFLSKISDNVKVGFFRWWFVGAIYFFVGWGTGLGNSKSAFDLIFILSLATSVGMIFIFNPIVYGMFEIERNGVIINKKINERSAWVGALMKIGEFFKCFIVTILVFFSYQFINLGINKWLGKTADTVVIKGEPIIYATLFVIFYNFLCFIIYKTYYLFKNIKIKKEVKE